MKLIDLYYRLYEKYGPQGWWPLLDCKGTNPTCAGIINGYHPGDYWFPKNYLQQFEIALGAILTQNITWVNVEKALINLQKYDLLNPEKIIKSDQEIILSVIKPCGYYNQKLKKILNLAHFFLFLKDKKPSRTDLLNIWGIGPETADSILLYAYKIPSFVVDAYTKKLFSTLNLVDTKMNLNEIKLFCEQELPPDFILFQEFHALIIEHSKQKKSIHELLEI